MNTHAVGKLRQPKLVTRTQILERACEMYFAHELIQGDERLSLVLESLGYTTGAGYQIWPNQASFRRDLQIFVAQRLDFDSLSAAFVACIDSATGANLDDTVASVGQELLESTLGHEGFYFSLRFLALGSACPVEVTEQLTEERLRVERALAFSLERLSRRVDQLSGIDASELAASLLALLAGFALRARVADDPDDGKGLFLSAVAALFGRRLGDPRLADSEGS